MVSTSDERSRQALVARIRPWEAFGVRRIHQLIAAIMRSPVLPSAAKLMKGEYRALDSDTLDESARWSLFFLRGNAIRVVLYVPMAIVLARREMWPALVLLAALAAIHLASVLVELYSRTVYRAMEALGDPPAPVEPTRLTKEELARRSAHAWFRPKRFESQALYTWLGVEALRRFVVFYTGALRQGSKSFVRRASRQDILEFENSTRSAEAMHGVAFLVNLPITLPLMIHGPWWIGVYAFLFSLIDLSMVLVQRLHRVRLWKFVLRAKCASH